LIWSDITGCMLDAPLSSKRSDGVDILRACLALWVIFSHLVPWAQIVQGSESLPASLGWIIRVLTHVFQTAGETHPAVQGFIVLSGYCIHRNGFRRNDIDIAGYAIRRTFRIYPVYVLATLAGILCFGVSSYFNHDLVRALSSTSSITPSCMIAKLAAISAFVPSLNVCVYQGNAPLATVMVEMWLYAVYPILIICVVRRYGERRLWLSLAALWTSGVVLITAFPGLQDWWHNGSLIGFLLYWWIGAKCVDESFIATIYRWRAASIIVWLALTAMLLLVGTTTPFIAELRKVAFALLFGLFVSHWDRRSVPIFRPAAFFGKAGYSLYAFHAPLIYTLLLADIPWLPTLAVAVAIGMISFRFCERPLLQFGKRLAASRAVPTV